MFHSKYSLQYESTVDVILCMIHSSKYIHITVIPELIYHDNLKICKINVYKLATSKYLYK